MTSLPLAAPGWTETPVNVTTALSAENVSTLISPVKPPSTVNATGQSKRSNGKRSAPRPISSSGLKQTLTVGHASSDSCVWTSRAAMMVAMPDLSSAPRSVLPSVVMSVSPTHSSNSGVSAGSITMPWPTSMAPPEYSSTSCGFTSLPV